MAVDFMLTVESEEMCQYRGYIGLHHNNLPEIVVDRIDYKILCRSDGIGSVWLLRWCIL